MDKNVKTMLLAAGTAFISASVPLISTGQFIEAGIIGAVGVAFLVIREYMKDEPVTA